MSTDLPRRTDLQEGMTVLVQQEQENNDSDPIVGDVKVVVSDEDFHPRGIEVELRSGVRGRVKDIHPEEP